MKQIVAILLYTICASVCLQAQPIPTYTIHGYINDICGNPVSGDVDVRIMTHKTFHCAVPDKYGYFEIQQVEKGKYKVFVASFKYGYHLFDSITVDDKTPNWLDLSVVCAAYIEPSNVFSYELKRLPNYNHVVCGMPSGTVQRDNEVSLYGSRGKDYVLYIDGIKMRHHQWLPVASIQEVDIWTMSIPANLDCSP